MSFLPSRTRVFLCLAHTDMRNYAEYRIMRMKQLDERPRWPTKHGCAKIVGDCTRHNQSFSRYAKRRSAGR